tara:strand:- start:1128 stop:1616 length:489 start_codon:yes stop_codon:yes gene_type:complete
MRYVSIIVAKSQNNVIGNDGQLPWHLTEDLKKFKSITMGKPMIMGRNTFESIGKALPGRKNIILTRNLNYSAENVCVVNTKKEAIDACGEQKEIMIIGGGEIYKEFISITNRLYLTNVDIEIEGDVFFPEINLLNWNLISREDYPRTTQREIGFNMEILERC